MKLWLHLTGKFILTVTRLSKEKKVQAKRKTSKLSNSFSIYCFNNFEDYIEFCNSPLNSFTSTVTSKLKKSVLYLYNSKYYLCINISNLGLKSFKPIHCSIIEFGTHVPDSDLFQRKLSEYGKIIFKSNAINNTYKYFKKES